MEMMAFATVTLLAGLIDDLRSRKVHNILLILISPVLFLASVHFRGMEGSLIGTTALVGALVVTIPLFMFGILGGGDVKLFSLFSFCLDPVSMIWTLIYSIIWGALFGLARALVQKNLLTLVRNTYRVARRQRVQVEEIQKIPYTFSLLLGWFTQLTLLHAGGVV